MPLLNYTTTISADKSVAEVQQILVRAGATRILIEYNGLMPSALAFEVAGVQYRLPCRVEAVYSVLSKDRDVRSGLRTREQAQRVAWRVLKDWVEAQLAIIQTGMVEAQEVFFPYQLTGNGETMYQVFARSDRLLTVEEP